MEIRTGIGQETASIGTEGTIAIAMTGIPIADSGMSGNHHTVGKGISPARQFEDFRARQAAIRAAGRNTKGTIFRGR